jgi:hypothetical protein
MSCTKLSLVVLMVVSVSSCSHLQPEDVKPWERGTLARDDMQLVPHPVQNGLDDHIYFSKEAASGGGGVGGGGCGCN